MRKNIRRRIKVFNSLAVVLFVIIVAGCSSADSSLKEDTERIASVMCRSIEVMNKLKAANPEDSVQVRTLQAEEQKMQAEMDVEYREFRKKHEKELENPEFNKKFSKFLRKAMLDCKYLSAEDRENFEREIGK
jgi:hypothetical protein